MPGPRYGKTEKKCGVKTPNVIPSEKIINSSVKEESGADAISPLFKDLEVSPYAGSSCAACNECRGK